MLKKFKGEWKTASSPATSTASTNTRPRSTSFDKLSSNSLERSPTLASIPLAQSTSFLEIPHSNKLHGRQRSSSLSSLKVQNAMGWKPAAANYVSIDLNSLPAKTDSYSNIRRVALLGHSRNPQSKLEQKENNIENFSNNPSKPIAILKKDNTEIKITLAGSLDEKIGSNSSISSELKVCSGSAPEKLGFIRVHRVARRSEGIQTASKPETPFGRRRSQSTPALLYSTKKTIMIGRKAHQALRHRSISQPGLSCYTKEMIQTTHASRSPSNTRPQDPKNKGGKSFSDKSQPKDLRTIVLHNNLSKSKRKPSKASKFTLRRKFSQDWIPTSSSLDIDDTEGKHFKKLYNRMIGEKKCSQTVRNAAAKKLLSLGWPQESVPGIREKIVNPTSIDFILTLAKNGEVLIHRVIERTELELTNLIWQGAGGKVYRGRWRGMEVAIKFSSEECINFDIEEFRLEVALMILLKHPHLLPCLGASADSRYNRTCFMVTPFMGGGDLQTAIRNSFPLLTNWNYKLKICIQLLEALVFLHSYNIIHRDIKSPNILLDEEKNVYIADFGSSTVHRKNRVMTCEIGTTRWTAPEVFTEGNLDSLYNCKVDIWSIGIVLWEIATLSDPYDGERNFDIPIKVINGYRLQIPCSVPNEFGQIITSCWHQNPEERPSAQDLYSSLCKYAVKM